MNKAHEGYVNMSKVITENQIREWVQEETVIINGDLFCAEGIKYDFRLGSNFLKAYFGRVMDYEKDLKSAEDIRKAVVEPGEVVFVLSRERLVLPSNVYAQLSPKRSLAQDGIELMGGLTIDPGYEGYLVFGLRNVAGTPYTLSPGTKIVAANFFELTNEEMLSEYKKPTSIESFPEKLLTLIEKYKPVNPQNLEIELKELQKAFRESQGQLGEDVRGLKEKVSQIANDLLKESTKREQENKSLSDRFSSVEMQLRELDSKTVKTDLKLDRMQEDIQKIGKNSDEIKDSIIKKNAEAGIKGKIGAIVATFLVTVLAGVIVALVEGWL
ncbi:MAG: hypothetical protein NC321_00270 [Clostridium sp.]|nr:hypothetical protein [Clostridium sp.]